MKVSVYSTAWNIIKHSFNYKESLDNWATFADEISIAVGTSEDDTYIALESYALERGYPVSLIRTSFDFESDSFAYGKTENAALQNCTGDLLIQQNLDERLGVDRRLNELYAIFQIHPEIGAFWVPTVDLYGSVDRYLPPCSKKWYIHRPGFFRGPVKFGIKPDGKPDYNLTSTDELVTAEGDLVPAVRLLRDETIEGLRVYAKAGWPVTYHTGYLSANDRISRSLWWKKYWENATGGDRNRHPTSVEEIASKNTELHGLPLWNSKQN